LLNSPTFTGTPQTTTPGTGTNSTTRIPTTEWVQSYFGNLTNSNTWTNTNNFSSIQLNGNDINTLYQPIQPTQLLYNSTVNMGSNTQILNTTSIIMVDGSLPIPLTLTLPKVNNTNNSNVGVQIKIINLTTYNLTIKTNNYNFQGLQTGNSYAISTNSITKLISYYSGQLLGYYWYVY
jgi:hypothetical protein